MKRISINLDECRANNYVLHFERRAYALAHPERNRIARLVENLPCPRLNMFGVEEFHPSDCQGWLLPKDYYNLARHLNVEPGNLLPWYWSEEGWNQFQSLWAGLSETVRFDMQAKGEVIHIYTQYPH